MSYRWALFLAYLSQVPRGLKLLTQKPEFWLGYFMGILTLLIIGTVIL